MCGLRLDKALTFVENIRSRSRAENLISNQLIRVNGLPAKPSYLVKENDLLEVSFPAPEVSQLTPLNLRLDILFEDSDILVVNKPPGLVVHPAAGHSHDTLVNALIAHTEDLSMKFGEERPGIVHRLDKDTSGILVVAKNDFSQDHLSQQFRERTVHRIYHALCLGIPYKPRGTLQSYLARHPNDRKRYASVLGKDRKPIRTQSDNPGVGKWAVTHFEVLRTHPAGLSYLSLKLETGRTHQIRVHLSEMGNSILADPIYGSDRKIKSIHGHQNQELVRSAGRSALHARELGFTHPRTGKNLFFQVPWPDLTELRKNFFGDLP